MLASAQERLAAVIADIKRRRAKAFAFALPTDLLDVFQVIGDGLAVMLKNIQDDPVNWDPMTPQAEQLQTVVTPSAWIKWLHEALSYLDRVDSSRLPYEIVWALQGLATELVATSTPVRIVLQPTFDFDYQIHPVESILEQRPGPQVAKDFRTSFILSLPSAECRSALLHTLFVHEVGHMVFDQHILPRIESRLEKLVEVVADGRTGVAGVAFRAEFARRVAALHKDAQADAEELLGIRNSMLEQASAVCLAWAKELCCDLIGIRIAGVAFLKAFETFFVPFFSSTEPLESHPDVWLRLKIISLYLEDLQIRSPRFKKASELFGDFQSPIVGVAAPDQSRLDFRFLLAHQVLQAHAGNSTLMMLVREVEKRTPFPADSDWFVPAVLAGLDELKQLVPPAAPIGKTQVNSYSDLLAFVVTVGWVFKLRHIDSWGERLGGSQQRRSDVLNQVTLKSLEAGALMLGFSRGVA